MLIRMHAQLLDERCKSRRKILRGPDAPPTIEFRTICEQKPTASEFLLRELDAIAERQAAGREAP